MLSFLFVFLIFMFLVGFILWDDMQTIKYKKLYDSSMYHSNDMENKTTDKIFEGVKVLPAYRLQLFSFDWHIHNHHSSYMTHTLFQILKINKSTWLFENRKIICSKLLHCMILVSRNSQQSKPIYWCNLHSEIRSR